MLAELCQNSIDAVKRKGKIEGDIRITVDATAKAISIEDNGTGIDPDRLAELLSPFSTDKDGVSDQVGQKGVGITFVIFASTWFKIESKHAKGIRRAAVTSASSWLSQNDDSPLLLEIDDQEPASAESTGVKIEFGLSEADHPLFALTNEQLKFVILTRTAIGNTSHIWGLPFAAKCTLTHKDIGGDNHGETFPCNYLLPTVGLKSEHWLTVESYEDWRKAGIRSDTDARRRLKGKVVVDKGSYSQAGRVNRYWCCFVPDRGAWEQLTTRIRALTSDEKAEIDAGDTTGETAYQFRPGLYVFTKGMPTGIRLELTTRGSAGYLGNFFVLIEDPSLRFDIGRKFIPGRLQGSLREKAGNLFRVYINDFVSFVSGRVDTSNPRWERDKMFESIARLPDLKSPLSKFAKRPDSQEATVAAIFFELLGSGKLGGLVPLVSGYKDKYDLHAKWNGRNTVIEFKYNLRGLMKDFDDERKMFDEVDVVVLWDIDEDDHRALGKSALEVEPLDRSAFSADDQHFPMASHQLTMAGVNPIELVLLRKVLKPDE